MWHGVGFRQFHARPGKPISFRQLVITYASASDKGIRLDPDPDMLVNWIRTHGGQLDLEILQEKEGWSLITKSAVQKDTVLATVPKRLCIFSQPEQMKSPLLPSAVFLMNNLDAQHWRTRLAIALLSERVR
ncbi:hypothetical protein EON64_18315, partial [archaeon]